MSETKKRERNAADKEMLAISRCYAVMRKLELNAEARMRVVEYLHKRSISDIEEEAQARFREQAQQQGMVQQANQNAKLPFG